jgi:hypothetical protein
MVTLLTDVEESLKAKLARDTLEPVEVVEGIRECFILTHRAFIQKRQPQRPVEEIDAITDEMVKDVLAEEGVRHESAPRATLRNVVRIIDEQLGFAAEPDLAAHHTEVIDQLINRLPTITIF